MLRILILLSLIILPSQASAGPGFRQSWFGRSATNGQCLDSAQVALSEMGWGQLVRSQHSVTVEDNEYTVHVNCSAPGIIVITIMRDTFAVSDEKFLQIKNAIKARVGN